MRLMFIWEELADSLWLAFFCCSLVPRLRFWRTCTRCCCSLGGKPFSTFTSTASGRRTPMCVFRRGMGHAVQRG
jgi:hypothetical protein